MTSESGWQHQTNEQQEWDCDHDLHIAWCNVAMGLATDYAEAYCNHQCCSHQCDDTQDYLAELMRARRELKRHLLKQPASIGAASDIGALREIETPADPAHMPDYDAPAVDLPQGYEPHELPEDYTGPLWIEGQLHQFERAVREHDIILLRQALECLERSDCLGYQANLPIITALRERIGEERRLNTELLAAVEAKPHAMQRRQDPLDEALNMGDGVYRP